jgi:ABC-2 type transport system ATP-binding protein
MTTPIRIEGLTKTYGRGTKAVEAVKGLHFQVEQGVVYGFLGPNGAGKTTTIAMLLGLATSSAGRAWLYDVPLERAHTVRARRVGSLIEGSALYPYMTGRANLAVLARTGGCYDARRIDELLDLVGMTDRADRKVSGYSLGMRQRIGLAAALLNDPQLIIMDEPTNGLDPHGIQEIRALIRRLVDDYGKTVFLSSHLLHEVEQVCDEVAIINRGELVQAGRVRDLLADQTALRIEAAPPEGAYATLCREFAVQPPVDGWLTVQAGRDDAPQIARALAAEGIAVYQMIAQRKTLEAYFLDVTEMNHA